MLIVVVSNVAVNVSSEEARAEIWLAHHVCPDCGYDLTANTSGTCPECGLRFSTNAVASEKPEISS
jgi:rubrerythrin